MVVLDTPVLSDRTNQKPNPGALDRSTVRNCPQLPGDLVDFNIARLRSVKLVEENLGRKHTSKTTLTRT